MAILLLDANIEASVTELPHLDAPAQLDARHHMSNFVPPAAALVLVGPIVAAPRAEQPALVMVAPPDTLTMLAMICMHPAVPFDCTEPLTLMFDVGR